MNASMITMPSAMYHPFASGSIAHDAAPTINTEYAVQSSKMGQIPLASVWVT